ncbi:rRNA methyltransferase [Actinoalloteichus hymeniacidonis]|uniref:rRNA methyltransferase AviRa n=1 Tax=Actinoalloteichus hymeniacidonis TaxID=340345 RepID=A0AAC9HNS2_9PSEU|nr:rRNA methyltransferase [Actinoalloteichus hymeniacidonis]AOS62787.1 RRNA methyltransferase AviRa [Actinoalloteichus hymeniacidonis]MBB5909182.1 hypothetical protein [Actinoalloteichus hymeniacidonis]
MPYRFAVEQTDHADLAGGAVLRSAPGLPAFPVRLATELFARAAARLPGGAELTMWDPLCGSGYLLTVLGLLHRGELGAVLGSDVDERATEVATANLALLTSAGLRARAGRLHEQAAEFDKPAYALAAEAAGRLAGLLLAGGGDLRAEVRRADALDPDALGGVVEGFPPVDLVLADLPYGEQTRWRGEHGAAAEPQARLLRALRPNLPDHAVLVLVDRSRKVVLPAGLRPLERFRIGTRSAVLLRAADLPT